MEGARRQASRIGGWTDDGEMEPSPLGDVKCQQQAGIVGLILKHEGGKGREGRKELAGLLAGWAGWISRQAAKEG